MDPAEREARDRKFQANLVDLTTPPSIIRIESFNVGWAAGVEYGEQRGARQERERIAAEVGGNIGRAIREREFAAPPEREQEEA